MTSRAFTKVGQAASTVEQEMRRIGYWSSGARPELNSNEIFGGTTFEKWLQYEFLPKIYRAVEVGSLVDVPAHRVGLAALRQYDYHSSVPEAHNLMQACFALEQALEAVDE